MNKNLLAALAIGGAAYWASKQPGGIKGTWQRLQHGFRDLQAGKDPGEVGQRFLRGEDAVIESTPTEELETAAPGYHQSTV